MAHTEMVTVRMSRGHLNTPWGFDIGPKVTVIKVENGSLADRAGLMNGDKLVELEGHQNLDQEFAKRLLLETKHQIELIVHRTTDAAHRVWKPLVSENAEYNKFQHSVHNVAKFNDTSERNTIDSGNSQPTNVPLKVSLEHKHPEVVPVPGMNVIAQPFGENREVRHLQYNSPMPLYSPQSAAEQYLQQTGGLFGTDRNLKKEKELPPYLRSETFRLIQESEQSKQFPSNAPVEQPMKSKSTSKDVGKVDSLAQNLSGLPQCFVCNRNIEGLMCRAYNQQMHGDCFRCSTCGNTLNNRGHHFINEKFYCDIHGSMLRAGGRDTTTTDRGALLKDKFQVPHQSRVMTEPISASSPPWKSQSLISASNRGVPPASSHYGQELNDLKKEMFNSSSNKEKEDIEKYKYGVATSTSSNNRTIMPPNDSMKKLSINSQMPSEKTNSLIAEVHKNEIPNRNVNIKPSNLYEQIRHSEEVGKGRGVLHNQGTQIPFCDECKKEIRGAYVHANGLAYCPNHFICANKECSRKLLDIGFVEENGNKYCESCFEAHIAPCCAKCYQPITADCLNALQKKWHPQCFVCAQCNRPFGNSAFFLEKDQPYCESDWNALFTTKCVSCHYPIEAGDRWVEALGVAYHSDCFNCTSCHINLEGESFYAKNGSPYCKLHA